MLWQIRFLVLLTVIPGLIGMVVLFVIGSVDIFKVMRATWHYVTGGNPVDIHARPYWRQHTLAFHTYGQRPDRTQQRDNVRGPSRPSHAVTRGGLHDMQSNVWRYTSTERSSSASQPWSAHFRRIRRAPP